MRPFIMAMTLVTAAVMTSPVQAQAVQAKGTAAAVSPSAPRDISLADPLRKPLITALRPVVEADLGQRVRFVVRTLRYQSDRQGDWAFIVARPQTLAGKPVDFRKTRHAERLEAGILDGDTLYALLQRNGGSRRWSVRDYVIGPTDVTYAGWPDEHGAPPALFDLPG